MQQTNFSENPNGKLFLDHFGDVRKYQPDKYVAGNVIEILYKGDHMGYAKVVAVAPFKFKQLKDTFSFVNCSKHAAYQANILNRMYNGGRMNNPETTFHHVVFEWTERNMEMHRDMLKDWWDKLVQKQPFINESQNPVS